MTDAAGTDRWIAAATGWARAHHVTLVAPYVDLEVVQHALCDRPIGAQVLLRQAAPGARARAGTARRATSGPVPLESGWPLSTVICVDLDYPDLIAPVRRTAGLLVVPANDWAGGFDAVHDRSAAWAAVLTGATGPARDGPWLLLGARRRGPRARAGVELRRPDGDGRRRSAGRVSHTQTAGCSGG